MKKNEQTSRKSTKERVIHQYAFLPNGVLELPKGARILTVTVEDGLPFVWALVDPTAGLELRRFHSFSTGECFDAEGLEYLATIHLSGGAEGSITVVHLFEDVASPLRADEYTEGS
ncbi:MAG: hypothetical protein JO202_13420 [Ktedonobacteraceae bacterium]|nr:hypothetical protein [Ktedonobacteraceae bacterium]